MVRSGVYDRSVGELFLLVAQLSLATLMGKSRSNGDHCSMVFARRVM